MDEMKDLEEQDLSTTGIQCLLHNTRRHFSTTQLQTGTLESSPKLFQSNEQRNFWILAPIELLPGG
jgi:hypothetical protein